MLSSLSCRASLLLSELLQLYVLLLVAYAVVSWIPSLRGRWTDYLSRLIEPVLLPMRRLIPPVGGLDLSFLILFIVVQWLSHAIVPPICYFYR
jgi:YggT family protein